MTTRVSWRRLLPEGVTIVLSILMAFAIDAWWDGARDAEAERRVLEDVRQDLLESRRDLEEVVALNREDLDLADVFLFEPAALPHLTADSATRVLDAVFRVKTYQPFDGTLRTADMSLIRDQDLRSQLGRWIGRSEDLMENTPLHHASRVRVEEAAGLGAFWIYMTGDSTTSPGETLTALRSDESFVHAVLMSMQDKQNSLGKASALIQVTDDLLSLLAPRG